MSIGLVRSRALAGVDAPEVRVEVFLSGGLPSFSVSGMAETAVRESKDRVRGAIINAGFRFPQERITVSLAPADMPKSGGRFDLAIALGILVASKRIPQQSLDALECYGELALNGEIKTLLIDANLRKPVLHEAFGVQRTPGISDHILADAPTRGAVLPSAPLDPGPELREHLLGRCSSLVLTSATLAAAIRWRDQVRNGPETDVDCGGGCPTACAAMAVACVRVRSAGQPSSKP